MEPVCGVGYGEQAAFDIFGLLCAFGGREVECLSVVGVVCYVIEVLNVGMDVCVAVVDAVCNLGWFGVVEVG